jgi:exonuclease III
MVQPAKEASVDVLLLQEANISQMQEASFTHQLHRRGWQTIHQHPPEKGRRGGVALLVREPCALVPLHREAFGEGQFLAAQILGLATPHSRFHI